MDSYFNIHDLWHLGALVVAVAVLKTDVSWLKGWCKKHEESDEKRFEIERQERQGLGQTVVEISNRVAFLEGSDQR